MPLTHTRVLLAASGGGKRRRHCTLSSRDLLQLFVFPHFVCTLADPCREHRWNAATAKISVGGNNDSHEMIHSITDAAAAQYLVANVPLAVVRSRRRNHKQAVSTTASTSCGKLLTRNHHKDCGLLLRHRPRTVPDSSTGQSRAASRRPPVDRRRRKMRGC